MKFKVGTTAYQRKTKTQRDVIVTIVIDETALARVLGERANQQPFDRKQGAARHHPRWGSHLVRQGQ
jgi:hypothetical protein